MSDLSGVPLALSRAGHDRVAARRADEAWLRSAWKDPATRVLLVAHGKTLVVDADPPSLLLVSPDEAPDGLRYLLGTDAEGVVYFAVGVEELPDGHVPVVLGDDRRGEVRVAGIRQVGAALDARDAGLLVHAVALDNWHRTHRFCARCGHPTQPVNAGHVRRCPDCGAEHFPRTDPAVIMLVVDDADRALLARQPSWPDRRYSILAGFVEPGESLEQAVAREVAEEVGITVGEVTYRASQPWPFPSSLMLGFRARAVTSEVRVGEDEISEARWFSRAELRRAMAAGEVLLPGWVSISRVLIEEWYGEELPAENRW
ncbi:NAD(+) diphosphatase [Carbonactinospora thermoautotrophica]|uniref:NAD(+) diphosphatase n=1 Tax=Carbonactinospora thermoautotrophica TaxID=1469144 RepID=UPI002271E493|nr:NAD(+) diphosphatase [Carbonactinospora thermoautotrophica]MCX9192541.1 NAD(+) diphosphatase [Carbonactinospora thermoautotrophica]